MNPRKRKDARGYYAVPTPAFGYGNNPEMIAVLHGLLT